MSELENDLIYLTGAARLVAEEPKDGKPAGAPKFTMVGYTGKVIEVGYGLPVVIDLKGIDVSRQRIPIFYAHDSYKGVGHTESLRIGDEGLVAEGRISRENQWAADVIASGKNGFPWQASVGGWITNKKTIREGESVEVNGRKIEGPVMLATRFALKEISFVELGADDQTHASVAAKLHQKERSMETSNEILKDEVKAGAADKAFTDLGSGETPDVQKIVAGAVKDAVDEMKAALKAEAEERARVDEIKARNTFGNAELQAQAIKEGWSADKFELEALRASRAAVPFVPTGGAEYTGDSLTAAALIAGGIPEERVAKAFRNGDDVMASAERLRGVGLRELIEISAFQHGARLGEFRRNENAWLKAAFSTAGVSGLLSNTLNKGLLEWYNAADQGWKKIVSETSTRDFKAYDQYYLTTAFGFEEVAPDGEIKHGAIGEDKFTNQAKTYGVQFVISRTMLINDDLGALMDIPKRLGLGAARTLAKRVWNTLTANPTGADGNAFFSEAHGNLITGADYALGVDGLSYARAQFAKQTDQNGDPIGVDPKVLCAPPEIGTMAEMLYNATYVNETTAQNKARPNLNGNAGKLTPVVSPYLSATGAPGASGTAYYLLADPNTVPVVQIAYLRGIKVPTIEQGALDFDRLGIGYRAYFDYGVALLDWRGAVKVTGTN